MKVSLLTKEFSEMKRVASSVGRCTALYKYKLRGDAYKAWTCTFPVGGHQDVVDSFLKGAACFPDIELLVNPSRSQIRGSTVVLVPSGWRALRDAIPLRRSGEITKLLAGPTVCNLPGQYGAIIADQAVDVCITASEWVAGLFREELSRAGKTQNVEVCPSGVDHIFWKPAKAEPDDDFQRALLYVKRSGAEREGATAEALAAAGKDVRRLVSGGHVRNEYKELLDWCDFVVVLGESETQGITMAQAWSMNRQTLVFDSPVISKYHNGGRYTTLGPALASPYLSQATGAFWKNGGDLSALLENMTKRSPRTWILQNLTNEITFSKLLKIFEIA